MLKFPPIIYDNWKSHYDFTLIELYGTFYISEFEAKKLIYTRYDTLIQMYLYFTIEYAMHRCWGTYAMSRAFQVIVIARTFAFIHVGINASACLINADQFVATRCALPYQPPVGDFRVVYRSIGRPVYRK